MSTGYDLRDVPAVPVGSRWALDTSPGGFLSSPSATFTMALRLLLNERRKAATPLTPAPVTLRLKMVVKRGEAYELAERGELVVIPDAVSERPGRISKLGAKAPGAAFDGLFLGEAPFYSELTDAKRGRQLAQLRPSCVSTGQRCAR